MKDTIVNPEQFSNTYQQDDYLEDDYLEPEELEPEELEKDNPKTLAKLPEWYGDAKEVIHYE